MIIQAQLFPDNFGFPLGGSQNWMDNAYGFNDFCVGLPQKQQLLQNLQQKSQSLCFDNNHQSMAFSQSVASQIEKQRQEIDRFICLQNERLKLALQEQRKQQIGLILRIYEDKSLVLLRHKEEEIAKAMNRTMELENFLRKMMIESQTWQRAAKENEAMVVSLKNTMEQLRENGCFTNGVEEDAESCCVERENRGGRGEREERETVCKSCNSRDSCVVFLPCRHLCSCQDCQASLNSCPVCGMVKKAIIEALF